MATRQTRKSRAFTLIELMIVVAIVGVLAALAVYGVRLYVVHAKTAEARNSLGQIAKDASTAFEKESMSGKIVGAGGKTAVVRALCASASATVPSAIGLVKGTKYQSNQAAGKDWDIDSATNKGFACLKFIMTMPQYYMYNYTSDGDINVPTEGTKFSAIANGDLNGNGVMSTFTILAAVAANNLYVGPSIIETDPDE